MTQNTPPSSTPSWVVNVLVAITGSFVGGLLVAGLTRQVSIFVVLGVIVALLLVVVIGYVATKQGLAAAIGAAVVGLLGGSLVVFLFVLPRTPSSATAPSPTVSNTALLPQNTAAATTSETTTSIGSNTPLATVTTAPSATTPPSASPTEVATTLPTQTVGIAAEPQNCKEASGVELLPKEGWHLKAENGPAEENKLIPADTLKDKDMVLVTYNLHGLLAQEGVGKNDSVIAFVGENGMDWYGISLAKPPSENGNNDVQTHAFPLKNFVSVPDTNRNFPGGLQIDQNRPRN